MGSAATPVKPAPLNNSLLWAVRIAVLAGPVIVCVFVILWGQALGKQLSRPACSPPSRWLFDGAHIAGLALAIAASLPACIFILWKLAGPELERGLAVARATGWLVLLPPGLVFVLLLLLGLLNFASGGGEGMGFVALFFAPLISGIPDFLGISTPPRSLSTNLIPVLSGLLALSQVLLVVFASRARATLRRGHGDTSSLGSADTFYGVPVVLGAIVTACLLLCLLLFHAGMTLMNQPIPRDPQIARITRVLNQIRESETTYSKTFQQGYSPTLAALGPPPDGTAPSAEAAGLIDKDLANGTAEGYTFRYGNLQWSHGKQSYKVSAHPAEDCQGQCFCSLLLNSDGNVREAANPRAGFGVIEAKPEPPPRPARKPARLVVETFPDAQVYLDGVFKGHAGPDGRLVIENIGSSKYHNNYNVLVLLPGDRYFEQRIELPRGKETTVQASEGEPIRP